MTDAESLWVDIDGDTERPEEDERAEEDSFDAFTNHVDTTKALAMKLIAIRKNHQATADLQTDMEAIRRARETEPDKDHSTSLGPLTKSFEDVRLIVNNSTIPDDHRLRADLIDLKAQLCRLTTEESQLQLHLPSLHHHLLTIKVTNSRR